MLSDDSLRLARERSELQRIWPVFEKLLVPAASDANLLVALADAQGTLLWVAGNHGAMDGAENVGFSAGANWANLRWARRLQGWRLRREAASRFPALSTSMSTCTT